MGLYRRISGSVQERKGLSSFRRISSSSVSTPNSSVSTPPASGNPDPYNYKLVRSAEYNDNSYVVIEVQYPDCTNYEGRKILVFEGTDTATLVKQGPLDPHFFLAGKYKSPIARFEPTDRGWEMAKRLVESLLTDSLENK